MINIISIVMRSVRGKDYINQVLQDYINQVLRCRDRS